MENFLVGIVGGSGSGKSTLVGIVRSALVEFTTLEQGDICVINLDNFYRPKDEVLDITGASDISEVLWDDPRLLDFGLLHDCLKALKSDQDFEMYEYSKTTNDRTDTRLTVSPGKVILAEGYLLFSDRPVQNLTDYEVFVHVYTESAKYRRLLRDNALYGRPYEYTLEQWYASVVPCYENHIRMFESGLDLKISTSGRNGYVKGVQQLLFRIVRGVEKKGYHVEYHNGFGKPGRQRKMIRQLYQDEMLSFERALRDKA